MGMPLNEYLSEAIGVVAQKSSISVTTAVVTQAIDMSKVRKILAIFWVGALAASEVITVTLQSCPTSGGSYVAIPGISFTLTKALTDDNKELLIELNAEYLNNTVGITQRFVQATFAGSIGSPAGVVVIAGGGPEEPMSNQNLANVKSINVFAN